MLQYVFLKHDHWSVFSVKENQCINGMLTPNIVPPERLTERVWSLNSSPHSSVSVGSRLLSHLLSHFRYGPNTSCSHYKSNRSDQRGAASLCYRNRAEITVFMCEQKPYLFDFRAASSVFVRKISTKKRVTNEKTTKRFIEIYPQTRCSVNLMGQPIISR